MEYVVYEDVFLMVKMVGSGCLSELEASSRENLTFRANGFICCLRMSHSLIHPSQLTLLMPFNEAFGPRKKQKSPLLFLSY